MKTVYPQIVTQGIPESVLTATLGYLGSLARNPRYPAPAGGYTLVPSRRNAASIESYILRTVYPTPPAGSGWAYNDTRTPVQFGHHLVLCPLNAEGQPINWLNDQGVPLRCWVDGALGDAGEVANRLIDYLDEQEAAAGTGITWARTITVGDGHSTRDKTIHVHIILTPSLQILSALGLGLRPSVRPCILQATKE